MIKVSQGVMDEFLSPAQKNLRLRFSDNTTLNNADIYTETMNLEQAICTEEQIRFGAVNSACFKVKIKGTAKRYKGLKVTPYIYTNSGGVTLGEFTVVNDELSDNREYRSLTAYDALNTVFEKDLSDWYTRLNLPMTLKNFRNSLFSNLGITQENTTLPNDNMTVERTVNTTDAVLSGKKILEAICEINGCFGAMAYVSNRSVFRYVTIKEDDSLYPRNDLYPNDTLYPHQGDVTLLDSSDILQGGLIYQEFVSKPVARVQLRNNTSDAGVVFPDVSTGNSYQITDNFLLYGKDATQLKEVASNFYDAIKHITYTPSKATMRGRPWQELGDLVIVDTKRASIVFPVLSRVLSGITALKDEFAAKGREEYTFNINSNKRQIDQLRQKTLEIITNVDELHATMTERVSDLDGRVESYKSEFQQTAQQIITTVNAHYDEQTQFQSQITQRADSIETTVTNGLTRASIIAKINETGQSSVKISADAVDISGLVTFSDLSTLGGTVINGANITTGSINADLITTGKIKSTTGNSVFDLGTGELHVGNNRKRVVIDSDDGSLKIQQKTSGGSWVDYGVGVGVNVARYGGGTTTGIAAGVLDALSVDTTIIQFQSPTGDFTGDYISNTGSNTLDIHIENKLRIAHGNSSPYTGFTGTVGDLTFVCGILVE